MVEGGTACGVIYIESVYFTALSHLAGVIFVVDIFLAEEWAKNTTRQDMTKFEQDKDMTRYDKKTTPVFGQYSGKTTDKNI